MHISSICNFAFVCYLIWSLFLFIIFHHLLSGSKTEMDSTTSNWSTLRTDMPEEIAKSLDTHTEILHLHAVYSSGYSSVPLLPEILTLKLSFPIGPDNNSFHPKHRGHYFLKKSTFYCLEPLTRKISSSTNNSNWFVRIEDAHDSRKVRFKDPLSKFTIKKLGKIGRLPHRAINLLDYKVREVGKSHGLVFVDISKNR